MLAKRNVFIGMKLDVEKLSAKAVKWWRRDQGMEEVYVWLQNSSFDSKPLQFELIVSLVEVVEFAAQCDPTTSTLQMHMSRILLALKYHLISKGDMV